MWEGAQDEMPQIPLIGIKGSAFRNFLRILYAQ